MTDTEKKIDIRNVNTAALAFLGDAVYEMYVREHVMKSGVSNAHKLHGMAVRYVCADGQALGLKSLMEDFLTADELALVKRGRNHRITSKARSADPMTYKMATAYEVLVGALYIEGKRERLEEIVAETLRRIEESKK